MEALQWANDKLRGHLDVDTRSGAMLDSPMLDAEVLLADALHVNKSWLFSHFSDPLDPDVLEAFRKNVEKRCQHEPVAYLTGRKEFYKRPFHVNRFTLIPRPATETLVEEAINAYQNNTASPVLFADIGTGSGAIAVTLAAETGAPVLASDIDRHALTVAKMNAKKHGVENRVACIRGDLLNPILESLSANDASVCNQLILCANLPYLTKHQWTDGQPELHYEPQHALVAGRDGLDAYWALYKQLMRRRTDLPDHITVLAEIDPSQAAEMETLIKHHFPHAILQIKKDLEGHDRVVICEL